MSLRHSAHCCYVSELILMYLISFGVQVLASHKITMIPPPAADAEPTARAAAPRTRQRPDHEEMVPDLEAFLKAHPEIKSVVKMAVVSSMKHASDVL